MIQKPVYPDFKLLTINDRELIDSYNHSKDPSSDISFFTLYSWSNKNLKTTFSTLYGNLVLSIPDVFGKGLNITLLGSNKIKTTISTLLKDYGSLSEVSSDIVAKLQGAGYKLSEEPENFEYVYDLEKVVNLEGSEFSEHRHKLSKFIKTYGDSIFVKQLKPGILWYKSTYKKLYKKWEDSTTDKDKLSHFEKAALKKFLIYRLKYNTLCYGFYLNSELVGFCSNVILNNKYVIGNHAKADKNIRGLYNFIFYTNCKLLKNRGYKYINLEQDIGDLGIRDYKMWWKPDHLIKKYKVELT